MNKRWWRGGVIGWMIFVKNYRYDSAGLESFRSWPHVTHGCIRLITDNAPDRSPLPTARHTTGDTLRSEVVGARGGTVPFPPARILRAITGRGLMLARHAAWQSDRSGEEQSSRWLCQPCLEDIPPTAIAHHIPGGGNHITSCSFWPPSTQVISRWKNRCPPPWWCCVDF